MKDNVDSPATSEVPEITDDQGMDDEVRVVETAHTNNASKLSQNTISDDHSIEENSKVDSTPPSLPVSISTNAVSPKRIEMSTNSDSVKDSSESNKVSPSLAIENTENNTNKEESLQVDSGPVIEIGNTSPNQNKAKSRRVSISDSDRGVNLTRATASKTLKTNLMSQRLILRATMARNKMTHHPKKNLVLGKENIQKLKNPLIPCDHHLKALEILLNLEMP